MKSATNLLFCSALLGITAVAGYAQDLWSDNFTANPAGRWLYFADTVMGGKSTGRVEFTSEGSRSFARMTGKVTTENNGGFIQIRRDMDDRLAKGLTGVRVFVRGNEQEYFVHLRTRGTRLPWQYYQASFYAGSGWQEVVIPFAEFEASGNFLRKTPSSQSIKSVGIVAFGREHEVALDVSEVGFF